jgi:sec-independent protein translocase protein TatC
MMGLEEKPFLDHIEDLRALIIKSLMVACGGAALGWLIVRWVIGILRAPLDKSLIAHHMNPNNFLITIGITDSFNLAFQIGLYTGLVLAAPVIFYFIGDYLLPALNFRERKLLLPAFIVGGLLFALGVVFCYFIVLEPSIGFFLDFNAWLGWQPMWTMQNYLEFALQMLIGVGLSFELPLILFILAKLGIISKAFLVEYRRHVIVILFIAACCITPTSDPFNLMLVFVPMYALYEGSIIAIGWLEKVRSKFQ